MDEFRVLCELNKASIAGISETWFKKSSLTNVRGYNLYRKDRADGRRGGGVALYIDEKLTSYEFDDVCLRMNIVE